MSVSVSVCLCVSVCPRGYLRSDTHDLYQIFVHVACGHGSVLLRQDDKITRQFFGISSPMTMHCTASAAK